MSNIHGLLVVVEDGVGVVVDVGVVVVVVELVVGEDVVLEYELVGVLGLDVA